MTLTNIGAAITPDLQTILGLAKNGFVFACGAAFEACRQHWRRVREAKARARKALSQLIERPSLLLSKGLPMDDLEQLSRRFGFRRNSLSRAMARCQRARENARQDAVGQPFVDEGEAKAALLELRDAL